MTETGWVGVESGGRKSDSRWYLRSSFSGFVWSERMDDLQQRSKQHVEFCGNRAELGNYPLDTVRGFQGARLEMVGIEAAILGMERLNCINVVGCVSLYC